MNNRKRMMKTGLSFLLTASLLAAPVYAAGESASGAEAQPAGESAAPETDAAVQKADAAQAQTDGFAAQTEEAFAEPEMKHRPYARWWLAEGSHTDETLIESIHELYDAGYGGVEFVTLDESKFLDDASYAWGSPEWIHDTHVIIEECAKLGMSVSMTSGTHWATANLVSINPDQEAASQELGCAAVTPEAGPDGVPAYDGEVPACSLPGNVTKQQLVKVLAAKVTERGSERTAKGKVQPSKLDMSSLQDVTDLVKEEGESHTISWTAPEAGDWDLFAFWQYGTGEAYRPAIDKSYTINYLSTEGAQALIDYWDQEVLTDEVQSLIDQIEECDLYMDSLELSVHGSDTTGQLWCADMEEQFSARNTYDIDTLLPFLIKRGGTFGAPNVYFYEPDDEAGQTYVDNFRLDFQQTQTELYMENCLQVLADWLHGRNMRLRAENSYGAPFEISEPAKVLDYVETESMEFGNELDSHRNMAGGTHLFGKRMSSETGAWISGNYIYDNNYYRQVFYMQYAAGVQKTVTHGYSAEYGPEEYVQWPGFEGMDAVWSERFNKRQPAQVDYAAQNLHYSRLQKALEAGVPQMDIGILRSDYAFNNRLTNGGMQNFVEKGVYSNKAHTQDGYYWRDMGLQNAGYTYDYFSPWLLTDEEVTCTDGLVNADGAAYQALLVVEDELPLEAAKVLLDWTKNGLPVVFVNNAVQLVANDEILKENGEVASRSGSNNAADEELAAVVSEIKEQANVRTVESEADAMAALQELGVLPRVMYSEPNTVLLPVLRSDTDADYLYLYHYMYEEVDDFETTVSVDGVYAPYFIDTWSGKVTAAENWRVKDGRTEIDVNIAPGETQLLALDKNTDVADGYETSAEAAETIVPVTGWTLTVDSFNPGEKLTRTEENEETGITTTEVAYDTEHVMLDAGALDALLPWKDIEAVGETVSGIGTYQTSFEADSAMLDESAHVIFRADSFEGGTAAVFVNGTQVPVNMDRRTADLSGLLVEGANTLEVRVTSSLRNKMRDVGYDQGWIILHPEAADYGMTGETWLVVVTNS